MSTRTLKETYAILQAVAEELKRQVPDFDPTPYWVKIDGDDLQVLDVFESGPSPRHVLACWQVPADFDGNTAAVVTALIREIKAEREPLPPVRVDSDGTLTDSAELDALLREIDGMEPGCRPGESPPGGGDEDDSDMEAMRRELEEDPERVDPWADLDEAKRENEKDEQP